jgi:hypothetical protein
MVSLLEMYSVFILALTRIDLDVSGWSTACARMSFLDEVVASHCGYVGCGIVGMVKDYGLA